MQITTTRRQCSAYQCSIHNSNFWVGGEMSNLIQVFHLDPLVKVYKVFLLAMQDPFLLQEDPTSAVPGFEKLFPHLDIPQSTVTTLDY